MKKSCISRKSMRIFLTTCNKSLNVSRATKYPGPSTTSNIVKGKFHCHVFGKSRIFAEFQNKWVKSRSKHTA